jgi:nucleotide-binding universal stress UspA family protein
MMNSRQDHIVCAIDVHDYDQGIVDLAAYFAKAAGVDLDIVHVTPLTNYDPEQGYSGSIRPLAAIAGDNGKLLKIAPTEKSILIRHHQLLGEPAKRILDFLNYGSPQLVVVGTHGRRGWKRLLLGSVAEYLLRHAQCPVAVFRRSLRNQPDRTSQVAGGDQKLHT